MNFEAACAIIALAGVLMFLAFSRLRRKFPALEAARDPQALARLRARGLMACRTCGATVPRPADETRDETWWCVRCRTAD